MSGFSEPRKAEAAFKFKGKNVTKQLKPYLKSVAYTDVASGDSDQLDLNLQNIGAEWLGKWYPTKGGRLPDFLQLDESRDGEDAAARRFHDG